MDVAFQRKNEKGGDKKVNIRDMVFIEFNSN